MTFMQRHLKCSLRPDRFGLTCVYKHDAECEHQDETYDNAPAPPEADASLDSPSFTPSALTEFAARGYERESRPPEDGASREARAWLNARVDARDIDHYRDQSVVATLATLLRAAERRGYERGLEEAAKECEAEAMRWDAANRGIAAIDSDVHRAAGAVLCTRRLRALRERAGSGR